MLDESSVCNRFPLLAFFFSSTYTVICCTCSVPVIQAALLCLRAILVMAFVISRRILAEKNYDTGILTHRTFYLLSKVLATVSMLPTMTACP